MHPRQDRLPDERVQGLHPTSELTERHAATSEGAEASRVFRRLLFVRRSYDERYEEQVFA